MTVDTSYLPDDGKDDRDMELRNQLRVEWLENQKRLKAQKIHIEYVFWDGSPHQKTVTVVKASAEIFDS